MKKREQVESIMCQILKDTGRKIEVKELAYMISQENKSNHVTSRLLGIICSMNPQINSEKIYKAGTTCVSYYFVDLENND